MVDVGGRPLIVGTTLDACVGATPPAEPQIHPAGPVRPVTEQEEPRWPMS
jgi:hypothetical protein